MAKVGKHELVWIYSMGKRFAITGIFDTDEEANRHLERHSNDAVIACLGGKVITANKYEGVRPDSYEP